MIERTADFVLLKPEMAFPFSSNRGPDWTNSRDEATAEREFRRVMESTPLLFSRKIPFPSDDAEFHAPEVLPPETTRPNGAPSGVKKPALMASMAFFDFATSDELE